MAALASGWWVNETASPDRKQYRYTWTSFGAQCYQGEAIAKKNARPHRK